MSDPIVSINGARADAAHLRVPFAGRWIVDLDYAGDDPPTGAAVVRLGDLELVGTVVSAFSGRFVGHVKVRVIAGADGWSRIVQRRSYHDDGGVRRVEVLSALARDTGETIDTAGDSTRGQIDFTRLEESGAAALEGILGAVPWRVDFDGVTRYGARPAAALAGAELLEVDVRTRQLTFGGDPSSVPIGAIVVDARLGAPLIVREVDVLVEGTKTRIHAWGVPS